MYVEGTIKINFYIHPLSLGFANIITSAKMYVTGFSDDYLFTTAYVTTAMIKRYVMPSFGPSLSEALVLVHTSSHELSSIVA